jgi:hypothetical protein
VILEKPSDFSAVALKLRTSVGDEPGDEPALNSPVNRRPVPFKTQAKP